MPRRSLRLQQAGYYTEEGAPSVIYKEAIWRVFRRRTSPRHGPHDTAVSGSGDAVDPAVADQACGCWAPHAETVDDNPTGTQATASTTKRTRTDQARGNTASPHCGFFAKISTGLLFLLLLGSVAHLQIQIRELQQEVHSLRERVSLIVPQAEMMQNFALESQGARILHHLSSATYWPREHIGVIWDRIFSWWCSTKIQRRVIQARSPLHPGQCWPFSGDRGHLVASLSHPVSVTHVTLGHITRHQSPHGSITSAPRTFSIYGLRSTDEEGTYLGTLFYDQDGTSHQTFQLSNPNNEVFRHVKMQVEGNWGNTDFTCIYSFRVHGKLPA